MVIPTKAASTARLAQWEVSLSMDDLQGPFQPKPCQDCRMGFHGMGNDPSVPNVSFKESKPQEQDLRDPRATSRASGGGGDSSTLDLE